MASVNPLSRELVFKIVYYGPGLGGKTTTLEYLHRTTKPEHRGKLVSLATPVDRTLYFDFLPVRLPPIRGMNVRLQLFTVPGQVYFNATRKLVLTGADGIVFVSDSQAGRADSNLESLENLRENLAEQGREIGQIPLVFQHNKRDLPDLLSIEELDEMLNPFDAISVPASARTGLGVFEGLELISERVLRAVEQRLPQELSGFGATFDAIEGGLVTALQDASPQLAYEPVVSRVNAPSVSWPSMPPHSTLGEPGPLELTAARTVIPEGEEGELPESDDMLPVDDDALVPLPVDELPAPSVDDPDLRGGEPLYPPVPPAPAPPSISTSGHDEHDEHEEIPAVTLPRAAGGARRAGASFALLWPPGERELCVEVEDAIAGAQYARAVVRCDALLERVVEQAADLLGSTQAARDPAVIPLLLGLEGRRYLGFRSVVQKARAGGDVSAREALSAFAFAIHARLAQSPI
ncbi:MAG TPA: GTPase domain-containing protein [Candidatus Nanopelagicales bacterium]|nr:GTPase domain-containing protein [Candidatus Nanopelagicales bacterium]